MQRIPNIAATAEPDPVKGRLPVGVTVVGVVLVGTVLPCSCTVVVVGCCGSPDSYVAWHGV